MKRSRWWSLTLVLIAAAPAGAQSGHDHSHGGGGFAGQGEAPFEHALRFVRFAALQQSQEHVHFFGMYIGNYPTLPRDKIRRLCEMLNRLAAEGDSN